MIAHCPIVHRPVDKLFPKAKKLRLSGKCPSCTKEIKTDEFRDQLSVKEYTISGLCQDCQDMVFQ